LLMGFLHDDGRDSATSHNRVTKRTSGTSIHSRAEEGTTVSFLFGPPS
jgi:hypothetical protein